MHSETQLNHIDLVFEHLVNHHQDSGFCMFYALHVAIDIDTVSQIQSAVNTSIRCTGLVRLGNPRSEQEDIGACIVRTEVKVA